MKNKIYVKTTMVILFISISIVTNAQIFYEINLANINSATQGSQISNTNSLDYGAAVKYSIKNNRFNIGLGYTGLYRNIFYNNEFIKPFQNNALLSFDWCLFSANNFRPMASLGIYSSFINKYETYELGYNIGYYTSFSVNYQNPSGYYLNLGIKNLSDFYNSTSTENALLDSYGFYIAWGVDLSKMFKKKQN